MKPSHRVHRIPIVTENAVVDSTDKPQDWRDERTEQPIAGKGVELPAGRQRPSQRGRTIESKRGSHT